MSFGFSAVNDNNIVQIDQNFKNFRLTSLFTINTPGGFYKPAGDHLVFFRALTYNNPADPSFYGCEQLSNVYRIRATKRSGKYNQPVRAILPIEVAIFEKTEFAGTPSGGYGLEVYDSSQDLVYSSNNAAMNVISAQAHNAFSNPGVELSFSVTPTAGRTAYVWAGGLYPDEDDGFEGNIYGNGVKFHSATSYTFSSGQVDFETYGFESAVFYQDKVQLIGEI